MAAVNHVESRAAEREAKAAAEAAAAQSTQEAEATAATDEVPCLAYGGAPGRGGAGF